ncbi:epidermal growth factor-like protein 7 isoform X3 [Heterocephalus glaber]|nr:epidermal growth factor-like protein 7 isoform X3 [Heterocephalus glaber]XP_021117379.1 epidermal growth factor-like protein 7 isoform X3 [Heterocephalus glaber]XP_021117380.1 epidermal growth factor-like protein 7 isoform X3 [Heterocephalus glaber]
MQGMWASQELLPLWLLVLAAGGSVHAYRPSRRVCAAGAAPGSVSESFVQRVYQPFLTTCDGHRACSTYRTIYRTAYRRGPGPGPTRPRYACCPGWKRTGGLPGACAAAICQPPCGNGGSCVRPGRCHCPAGWQGNTCHTDVDECSSGGVGCPQGCVNTAGSYQCQCREGHSASADGTHCLPTAGPPRVALNPVTGVDPAARAEVQRLQARVEVLEQKLQLVLDPLHGLASQAPEQGPQAPGSLLAHSLQQLDRIDSLSEQISFLEEQLGSCECPCHLPSLRTPGSSRPEGGTGNGRRPGDPAFSSTPGSCKQL